MRKRIQFLIGAIFALSMMAAPAQALTLMNPGDSFSPITDGEVYRSTQSVFPGAFSHSYSFTYTTSLPTTASAVSIALSAANSGFSALTLQWDGPTAVFQTFDVLLGQANNVPLSLADGLGTYVLTVFGVAKNGTGLYAAELLAQGGASETPIPGAVLLFGSVLAGGIGLMRRRRTVGAAA